LPVAPIQFSYEINHETSQKMAIHLRARGQQDKKTKNKQQVIFVLPMARIRSLGFLSVGRLPLSLASKSRTLLLSDSLPSAPLPRPGLALRSCKTEKPVKNERDKTIDQTETRRRQTLANIFQRKTNERTQDTKKENTVRHSLELVFKLGMLAMGGKGVRYFQSGRLNMDELDACLEIRG
jgi:hypothetical protein